MLGAFVVRGINTETSIKPQNIKKRFKILSAKKPKIGCNIDEHICEMLIIIAAIDIENPSLDAIKGIIGFKKPVYISQAKCAAHNHIIALFTLFILFFMQTLYNKSH